MDPRSSPATHLKAPHGAVQQLAVAAGTRFPHLTRARQHTESELARVRGQLTDAPCPSDASVVVFGSWGRGELTRGNDHDWAILVDAGDTDQRPDITRLDSAVRKVLGADERKPGTQDVFGQAFGCDELVEQIGLDKDSNTLLTRRMLVLLESAPVLNPDVHNASCTISSVHSRPTGSRMRSSRTTKDAASRPEPAVCGPTTASSRSWTPQR